MTKKESHPSKASVPSIPGLGDIHDGERALHELMPEIQALPDDKVTKPNVDVPDAAGIAAGAYEGIAFFREEIRTQLPKFEMKHLDKLKVYALAAWHAATIAPAHSTNKPLDALMTDAISLFEDLGIAGNALAHKGFIDAASLARSGTKNRDIANDLNKRVTAFREVWAEVDGQTTVKKADLDRGAELAASILLAIENAAHPPVSPATELRFRAYTVFEHAYEDCRRAIQYLRYFEGDAENFAPTLRQMAKGRAAPGEKSGDGAAATTAKPAEPAQPAVSVPVSIGKPIGGGGEPFTK